MASIGFSGIISGIDTQAIVDAVIAARSRPIGQIEDRISAAEARKSALGDLRSTLSNLLSKVQILNSATALSGKTVVAGLSSSGAKKVVSAAADSSAAVGAFTVSVEQLATATTVASAARIGQPVSQNVPLAEAGFGTAPTEGTFTINGVALTIDENTVLSDGVDDGASNSILGKINNAGVGVTASIVNDGAGNPNLLQLSANSAITMGAGGDTSNFLEAAHIQAAPQETGSPPPYTYTSTAGLGQVQLGANLSDARLATALSPSTGSFKINGVAINWDANSNSLNGIIGAINSASAGVTAAYDVNTDSVVLTANKTGSSSIALEDVSGNFLAAVGLLGTPQTSGQNAAYKINNGATQYSTSNTITAAVPGVTLTLLEAAPGDNATVTVSNNDAGIIKAVEDFVSQFNSTMSLLHDATKIDTEGTNGPLASDSTIRGIQQSLRSLATGFANNLTTQYTNATQVGLSFGAVGSAVGTTGTLQLDSAKLQDAITTDRNAVIQLFSALTVDATFTPGGGSIAGIAGTPDKLTPGAYDITDDGAGNLTLSFTKEGSQTATVTTGTITAGGTNTTLIPGVTLTAADPLVAGTDTITVTRDKVGLATKLQDLLDIALTSGGSLDTKTETIDNQVEDYNAQIAKIEDSLIAEQARLERQFAQMEQIFARFQQQQGFLESLASTFSSNRKK